MKTTKAGWFTGVALGCLAAGCSTQDRSVKAGENRPADAVFNDDEDDDEGDQALALSQVPEAITEAALAAVPGFVLSSAEMETEDGTVIYSLEGTADGEAVEVEVRASDSKVLEIEQGDDEDDDGDDD